MLALKVRSVDKDDPIFKQGLTIFTPRSARPKPQQQPPNVEEEQE